MAAGLSDCEHRDHQADDGDADAKVEGVWPQSPLARDEPRDPRHQADGHVPRELVQTEGETPSPWADEVDLHDHSHRPSHRLVGAQQHVREVDPPPRGRKDDEKRHRQREQPTDDEDRLATDAIRQSRGNEIQQRLGDAKTDDERRDGRLRRESELLLAQQRQHRALEADHRADERIKANEQHELREVLSQSELRSHAVRPRLIRRFSAN